jgi:uncharacterized protein YfaP (DUF2135 family)
VLQNVESFLNCRSLRILTATTMSKYLLSAIILLFNFSILFAQPANDACSNAITLPCGTTNLAGTTVGAVSETSPGTCVGNYGVWYTFVGNGAPTTISVTSPMDIGVSFKSGSCGSLANVTCIDGPGAGGTETYTFTPTNGTTYYVYVAYWSTGTTTNTFTITRTCVTPPSNDACSNATPITCGTTNLAGTTVNSVSETAPGTCVGNYGVWYSFVGGGVSTTISVTSPMDIGVSIKSGSCGSLANVDCVDGPGAGGTETYTFTPTSGTTYYIYVAYWSTGTTTNTFTISLACTNPPANDACANATALPCGTNALAGTTVGTVSETAPPGCNTFITNYGVWYSFVGDGNITTITVQETGGFDTGVGIYSGSCGVLTNLYCLDAVGASNPEIQTFTTTNGVTYFIYVSYFDTGSALTGTFTISRTCVAAPTPPANDACANATPLPCGTSSLAGTTVNAVSETAPSGCGGYITNYGVWYSFVGDGDITTITLQETGGFDTGMGIYSGSCGALTNLYCADAVGASNPEVQSFPTTNGVTYFIYVSYFDTGSTLTGTFVISRSCSEPSAQDCPGAVQICNDQTMSGNSGGFGTQELNSSNFGCFAGGISEEEDQSSWYFFQATTNGTLEFTLNSNPGVDYDFIIWGPNKSCASLGTPIRCDASEVDEETGMVTLNPYTSAPVTNTSSAPGPTSTWIQSLPVQTGEVYIMMVNNFTANNTPFSLDWTFSVPNLLNCTPISLPIEFGNFQGYKKQYFNQLKWSSLSEHGNAYYTIERSTNGNHWQEIHEEQGALNSISTLLYQYYDDNFVRNQVNYYRLSQTDIDGFRTELEVISIDNRSSNNTILRRINMLGQVVDENYKGLVIIEFEDGSIQKIIQ